MAKKTATAIHCIYLKAGEEPVKPGSTFSAEADVVDDLIAEGAAVAGKVDPLDHDGNGRKGGAVKPVSDEGQAPA